MPRLVEHAEHLAPQVDRPHALDVAHLATLREFFVLGVLALELGAVGVVQVRHFVG